MNSTCRSFTDSRGVAGRPRSWITAGASSGSVVSAAWIMTPWLLRVGADGGEVDAPTLDRDVPIGGPGPSDYVQCRYVLSRPRPAALQRRFRARTTIPVRAEVGRPSRATTWPLTRTASMPVGGL